MQEFIFYVIITGMEDSKRQNIIIEIANLKKLRESETDSAMRELIDEELKQVEFSLIDKDPDDQKNVILEIRSGAGGDEAELFAAQLWRMDKKYSEKCGWQISLMDSSITSIGGVKFLVAEISGENVYRHLKYESGVHRVQRVPETEKSGRVHTSTATAAILPEAQEVDFEINPKDLKIDIYCAGGHGGQNVNKRETAIRITHIPTGIVVACQTERSLGSNKENALAILEAKILQSQEESQNAKMQDDRRTQVGKMERSEKIRTYNYPQDRVTDHRIKKSWHNLEEIMQGKLDEIIDEIERELNK